MASPPDEADRFTYDLTEELNSLVSSHLGADLDLAADRRPRSEAPPQELMNWVPFAEIGNHIRDTLQANTHLWAQVADDCRLALAQDIVSNHIPLGDLVSSSLFLSPDTILRVLRRLAARYANLGISVYIPESSNPSQQTPFTLFITKAHKETAYAYLTKVWQSVDQLIVSSHPCLSSDFVFSLIGQLPGMPHLARQVVATGTKWDEDLGYPFWHTPSSSGRPQKLFGNPAVQYIIHQLLANVGSDLCITTREVVNDPTNPDDIILIDPRRFCVIEKTAFALSWIVVEMQARITDTCYSFQTTPILTTDRVECVERERLLFHGFLDSIVNPEDDRLEPLNRFLEWHLPDGQ